MSDTLGAKMSAPRPFSDCAGIGTPDHAQNECLMELTVAQPLFQTLLGVQRPFSRLHSEAETQSHNRVRDQVDTYCNLETKSILRD